MSAILKKWECQKWSYTRLAPTRYNVLLLMLEQWTAY